MTEPKVTLIGDTECFHGFWSIGFERVSDGRVRTFELSRRTTPDQWTERRETIRQIMLQNRTVGYNWRGYDLIMIAYMLQGANNEQLKSASDRIIQGNMRPWDAERMLDIRIPQGWDAIDLIEPQPNAFASLKALAGRLHAPKMQDLPYPPDAWLTDEQIDETMLYMVNDLNNTRLVWDALQEPINSRIALTEKHGIDLRSKSDAQIGEAIVRKQVEALTGQRVEKVETPPGTVFKYHLPDFISFGNPELQEIANRLRTTEFIVGGNGKAELPGWLDGKLVTIGESTYAMGIGGLHSTESNRSVLSDHEHVLIDADVAAFYPEIILRSGLYPKALGPHFVTAYRGIKEGRVTAKRRAKEIKRQLASDTSIAAIIIAELNVELARAIEDDKGGKIQINGVFGKLGSIFSVLYAPHLMIYITLTGQLSLLMLIDRAERAGFPVVSANTDGLVFRCPRSREAELMALTKQWEQETGFELEYTRYRGLYNKSVNSYIAITEDGKAKRKGPLANPRADGDTRAQLMINPTMNICADAATEYLKNRTPVEETIRKCTDIREFVTVVKVQSGGTWKGDYLGKHVRFIWSTQGEPIYYSEPHPTTGNYKKASKTDGCRPVMQLPEELPIDIDYDRYIAEARRILVDIGGMYAPPVVKRPRVYKRDLYRWLALALAA